MSPSVRRDGRKRGGTRTTRIAGTTTATGSPAEGHVGYTWNNIYEHKPFLRGLNGVLPVRCASFLCYTGRSGDVIHHTVRERYT